MHSNKPHVARAPRGDDARAYFFTPEGFREFEAVVENLEEMIVVVDRDDRYRMANRAYLKFRAARREQFFGHRAHEVVSPQVVETDIKPKLDECFQNHIVKFELTYTYPHLGERNLFKSYFPVSGPSGVERVASVVQDITERKRADELIDQDRDRAQRYLDIADVILLALDPEGRITLIKRKGCATLGRAESELLARDWFDSCWPARIRRELRASFRSLLDGDIS
jgi:PAS domain S-box-containing protein